MTTTDSPARILLADDEDTFLRATAELLRLRGYAVIEATDAHRARTALREHRFDAVVADIKMPGNTRLEFVRELRELAPSVPVILMTGYPSLETAMQSVELPVAAYLTKPIDLDGLCMHLEEAVERSRLLGLVRGAQARAAERTDALAQMQRGLTEASAGSYEQVLDGIFDLIFQGTVEAYVDLRQLLQVVKDRDPGALVAGLRNDPDRKELVGALEEAVDVLEQTKTAFKSKQLGDLRRRLEDVLHATSM